MEIEKRLMLSYLKRRYPVHRMKFNNRFKRTIVLENGVFLLSDQASINILTQSLTQTLKHIFNSDDYLVKDVLKSFLNLT